jgi:patatin-like phospholipase/acyl hydrolase
VQNGFYLVNRRRGHQGYYPRGFFLIEFEKRTGKPISELFDIIAGTSTGGILAVALTVPGSRGRPKYSAEKIYSLYIEHGGTIFNRSLLRSAATLGGLLGPKYSPRGLESLLEQYFGDKRLHETLTEIIVTAYDMASSTPWFFKTSFAKNHRAPEDDPLLAQVVRATTAVPAFFPPLTMEGHCMVDGGVFASNPGLCAYAHAKNLYPEETEFLVISLGTGVQTHHRPCSKIKDWGIADWAVPIIAVLLNSSSETVNYQMKTLVGGENYARFQVKLDDQTAEMDDASPENIRRLEALAQAAVRENSAKIDQLCSRLMKREEKSRPVKRNARVYTY